MEFEKKFLRPVENEDKNPEKMSRRDFLKAAAGGLGFSVIGAEAYEAEASDSTVMNHGELALIESKNTHIEYPDTPEALTPEMGQLLTDIVEYQNRIADATGRTARNAAHDEEVMTSHSMPSPSFFEEQHSVLWEKLKHLIPSLPPYSTQAFYRAINYDVPRLFAPYGIFVKPIEHPSMDIDADRFHNFETPLGFYRIRTVEHETVEQWGERFKRDIVNLDGPVLLSDRDVNEGVLPPFTSSGQTFYQNVLLYRATLEKEASEALPLFKKLADAALQNGLTEEVLKERSLQSLRNTQNPQGVALTTAAMRLAIRMVREGISFDDKRSQILEHETRHALDQRDPVFNDYFKPKLLSSPHEFMRAGINESVHEEIDGALGELRYGKNKALSLAGVLIYMNAPLGGDFRHQVALRWVGKSMVEILARNPEAFHITIDASLSVAPEHQAILALPDLVERHGDFDSLCQEVWKAHRERFSDDFFEEYLKTSNFGKSRRKQGASPRLTSTGIVSALGLGALYGAYRLYQRRQEVKEAERKKDQKSKRKK